MRISLQAISLLLPVFNAAFVVPTAIFPRSHRQDTRYGAIVSISAYIAVDLNMWL
jgi:hypothetical protein